MPTHPSTSKSAAQLFAAKKRALFLEALSECGNVTTAAKAADITPRRLYQVRKVDEAFALAWDEAAEVGAQALEDEARRRAYEGTEEPLTCAKGLIYDGEGRPVSVRKYSDTLLIFLLKGARPEKYRDKVDVKASVQGNMSHDINLATDSEAAAIAGAFFRRLTELRAGEPAGAGLSGE